ncbi:MAG: hypothetical protein OEN50_19520, partial [Deltaproteobacteria bacterium]|nr:hypothetical protein [Deltaproteobacteria bacterium]
MNRFNRARVLASWAGACMLVLCGVQASRAQSMEELHKRAVKEGGALNFYGTLAQINAEKILPVF